MRRFPLSLKPSPLPYTDQGSAPGPPYAVSFFLQPAVWGFGSRRLISQSFLGAKAGRPDRDAGEWRNLFLLW